MTGKKRAALSPALPLGALALLFVLGLSLFSGSGGRSYSRVPSYELMVRDVKQGDPSIRIPPEDLLPGTDMTCMVSYGGLWFASRGEGYLITTGGSPSIEIKCHPADDSSGYFPLRQDTELAGVPVHVSLDDSIDDGLWVGQLLFDLEGYRYWVRWESREEIPEAPYPLLEEIALSILEDG